MSRAFAVLLLLAFPALGQQQPKRLPSKDRPLQDRINTAVDLGIAHLREAAPADGLFRGCFRGQFGACGPTALALSTLAAAGVPAEDPVVTPSPVERR